MSRKCAEVEFQVVLNHVDILAIKNLFVLLSVAEEQPVGRVSNLRVVESLGSTVRLGWTGVAGATQYRIIILNTEGALADFIHYFVIHFDFFFSGQFCVKTCL